MLSCIDARVTKISISPSCDQESVRKWQKVCKRTNACYCGLVGHFTAKKTKETRRQNLILHKLQQHIEISHYGSGDLMSPAHF